MSMYARATRTQLNPSCLKKNVIREKVIMASNVMSLRTGSIWSMLIKPILWAQVLQVELNGPMYHAQGHLLSVREVAAVLIAGQRSPYFLNHECIEIYTVKQEYQNFFEEIFWETVEAIQMGVVKKLWSKFKVPNWGLTNACSYQINPLTYFRGASVSFRHILIASQPFIERRTDNGMKSTHFGLHSYST